MSLYLDAQENPRVGVIIWHIIAGIMIVIFSVMAGCPRYNVWQQGLAGEAELRRAEQNRQIAVQEAQAKRDSASLYAEAEVARARGVAEANHIIAQGLGGPEGYLRYLWIHSVSESSNQIIYVPTEAQIPILEAGKRRSAIAAPAPE